MAYFVGNRIAGFLSCFNQCIFDKINRAYDYHANLDAMFAVGAGILSGIFSVNEKKEDRNLASKIHGVASSLGFIALAFSPLFLSILSFGQHETILGILAAVCFALGLVCFVLFVMADKAKFKDTWIENEGLWQRLTLMCMYLPFVIVSIQELIK